VKNTLGEIVLSRSIFYYLSFYKWFKDKLFVQLLKNSSWILTGTVISTIIGFLVTIIRARVLSLEDFGLFVLIISYVEVISKFVSFQPWQALIKFGSLSLTKKNRQELFGYIKLSMKLDLLTAFSGFILTNIIALIYIIISKNDMDIAFWIFIYSLSLLFRIDGTSLGILRLFDKFKIILQLKIIIPSCI
jgi:O-antigen/teichoic acid export membrane protein